MATKKICDRCGNKINPACSLTYVTVSKHLYDGTPPYELCCSCAYHAKKWLNNEPPKEN